MHEQVLNHMQRAVRGIDGLGDTTEVGHGPISEVRVVREGLVGQSQEQCFSRQFERRNFESASKPKPSILFRSSSHRVRALVVGPWDSVGKRPESERVSIRCREAVMCPRAITP